MDTSVPKSTDERIAAALRELDVSQDFRISEAFVSEVLGLIADQPDLLDLKIASAAVTEMRGAFGCSNSREVKKVSIFGSAAARTIRSTTRHIASPHDWPTPGGWS
ncbi:MAG: hypothetical protein R2697_04325 [Ilumatobacteraceae bacterium]